VKEHGKDVYIWISSMFGVPWDRGWSGFEGCSMMLY
jgi:hypothetical protein